MRCIKSIKIALWLGALLISTHSMAQWRPLSDSGLKDTPRLELNNLNNKTVSLENYKDHVVLVNFWATWCTPCVQEIPLLMDFYRQHAANGWQLLGLAIDQPTPVKRFIAEMNMTYPVALAGLNGTELMKALGNERGGLPFTMALAADGRILMKKLGQLHAPDLADLAKVS